jgi:quinol monooxygenase YgiN
MILINLKVSVRPERREEWLALARQYRADVTAEPGNVYFEWATDIEDPNVFVAVECFVDSDAGSAHVGTEHFKQFVAAAPDLVAAQPQIVYVESPSINGWGPMGEIQPR